MEVGASSQSVPTDVHQHLILSLIQNKRNLDLSKKKNSVMHLYQMEDISRHQLCTAPASKNQMHAGDL